MYTLYTYRYIYTKGACNSAIVDDVDRVVLQLQLDAPFTFRFLQ